MVLKFLIVIPVYDNPSTIGQVVQGCLEKTEDPILVVDDGSQVAVETLFPQHSRVTVLRHEKNQGKGQALKSAFKWATARGFTHAITVDGDGQHRPEEICLLRDKSSAHPWALILGTRNLSGPHVPSISLFGRKFSNFWVNYETGIFVSDSQSGFRSYPLFHVQCLKLKSHRYDLEIEILIDLIWKNLQVLEVPIEPIYFPAEKRVSHFRKIRDNARISWLNVRLVLISLLRIQRSSRVLATSIAVGVLVGMSPLYGLQSIIGVGLALFLRLNVVMVLLATQISIPPLAPLIAFSSIKLGRFLLGHNSTLPLEFNIQFMETFFIDWLVGGLVLGASLGSLLGIAFYFSHLYLLSRARKNWSGNSRGGKFGNGFMKWVTKHLGLSSAYFCLLFIVPYFYLFAPKARRAVHQYWAVLKPDATRWQQIGFVMKHFYRFGQVLLDRLYQSYRKEQVFFPNSHGLENISDPILNKKPIVLVGAHTGGWDIAARYLAWEGVDKNFHPIQLQANGVTFEQNLRQDESSNQQKMLVNRMELPIFSIYEKLNQGKTVGFMGDRPLSERFELVAFFGKLAAFDTTPFKIAAATQVPIVMSLGFKAEGEGYDFFATRAKKLSYESDKPKDEQIREWVSEFASYLEGMLKQYPDQWFNFFEFWSALPQAVALFDRKEKQHSQLAENIPPAEKSALGFDSRPNGAPVTP